MDSPSIPSSGNQLIVASSIDEDEDNDWNNHNNNDNDDDDMETDSRPSRFPSEHANLQTDLYTPEGKRPLATPQQGEKTSPGARLLRSPHPRSSCSPSHSASPRSKQGTPFRNGLKVAVRSSSILDVVGAVTEKKTKVTESPRKRRAEMIQSNKIEQYFPKRTPH